MARQGGAGQGAARRGGARQGKDRMTITISTTDRGEVRTMLNAQRYKDALREMDEYLRRAIKYDDKPWQEVRDALYTILGECGVELDDDFEPTEESGCACGRAAAAGGDGEDSTP